MRRQILIIVNPAAGRARSAERFLRRFVAALQGQGCTAVLRRAGPSPSDAERLAGEAEPAFEAIVAAGGDGTVNAVVNGLAARPLPVGVLPLGSANVLAREIGLPRDPEALASLIASGPVSPVWPGRVGARLFVAMASAGIDSEIVAAVDPRLKRRAGRLAFAWAFLVLLWRYRACQLTIRADDVEYRAAAVIAANARHYAGPFIVAPDADLAAPTFELVLLRRAGRWAVLRSAGAILRRRLGRLAEITIVRARQAAISADRPLPVQADGEIVGNVPVTIEVADRPLLLIRPGA